MPDIFYEIFDNLPRGGSGDNESTRKAFSLLKNLPESTNILDVGCGPGMQTIELAKLIKMGASLISYRLGYQNRENCVRDIENIRTWWEGS